MPDTPNKLPKGASTELGKSGTLIYSGLITAEDYNKNLYGVRGNQKYEIMRRSDSTIRSALQIVKLPIQSAKWGIEAVKDEDGNVDEADQEKANFLKNELFNRNINFTKFIKQAVTHFDFGYSVFEKVFEAFEYEGQTRIGIKKLASRKQLTIYRWETKEKTPGVTQMIGDGSIISIPREKLIIFTHDQEGDNYEGISLLRYVYKEWDLKDKLMIVNAIALEKLGVGVPVVSIRDGETAAPNDEDDAIDALQNMRANEAAYLKLPASVQVEMLDLKGSSTKEIEPFIRYLDGRIMTAILARFMEIGGDAGSGSQALSKDLSSIFMKSEEAVAKDIVAAITEDLIKQLMDLNYSDMSSGYPKLTFGTIADDDNIALATTVGALVTAGAVTADPGLENELRERLHLPIISDDDIEKYKSSTVVVPPAEDMTSTSKATPVSKKETDKIDVKASLEAARNIRDYLVGASAEG